MQDLWVYDVECFPNFHSCFFINVFTNEEKYFVLWYNSENDEFIDHSIQYFNFLNTLKRNKSSCMIGFNNLSYDYSIIHELMKNEHSTHNVRDLVNLLKKKNDQLINDNIGNKPSFKSIPERYHYIPQLDLFKIHHFDNVGRSTNLKRLAINMRWSDIRNLPLPPNSKINKEQIDEIIFYNRNDTLITKEFYWISRGDKSKITVNFPGLNTYYIGKDRIQFRKDTSKEYNINCLNYSDVKIGEEINKQVYLKISGRTWDEIKDKKTYRTNIKLKDLIPSYITYKDNSLVKLLDIIRNTTITIGNEKFKYEFVFANNIWTFGLGGIHTKDKGRITIPSNDEYFEERDVSSMYPNKIITAGLFPEHLGVEWLVGYTANKDKRLSLKHHAKKDPIIQMVVDVIKLSLNGGGYGKMGDVWNWQYDPLQKYITTIQCQLDIMMLADMLVQEVPIEIESGNTDGINILYKKIYTDKVQEICKHWEQLTNAELETTRYSKVIRTTVNDYMAIKYDGSIKYKGDFELDKELHKNTDMFIIRKAIDNYYRQGVPVSKTIQDCTNIYDFTKSIKIQNTAHGKWKAIYDCLNGSNIERSELQKNIRYYIDTSGKGKLRKLCYEGKSQNKIINVEANNSVILFNQFFSKPKFEDYKVNYTYYITEATKIINSVSDKQLSLW